MAKRNMVQYGLLNSACSAYFAMVEIHNKPKFQYRYETVSLLMINAWELVLKCYVWKYLKKQRSIFENENETVDKETESKRLQEPKTISLQKALDFVKQDYCAKGKKEFLAVKENISSIEEYRNKITHFYCDELNPYIFSLIARSALYFVEFVKENFSKDIGKDDGLFILPLGFNLPFEPDKFLSVKAINAANISIDGMEFIHSIIDKTNELKEQGIEDSIFLGFGVYFDSVKKYKNSDIIATIDNQNPTGTVVRNPKQVRLSNDPNAQEVKVSADEMLKIYKYVHEDLVKYCKDNIKDFKQIPIFNDIKREAQKNKVYTYKNLLDPKKPNGAKKWFYSQQGLEFIKDEYIKRVCEANSTSNHDEK